MAAPSDVTSMALFCDFENVALGVRDANYEKFDIKKVLERLLLKGSIVVKKAYCDWDRYKAFKGPMHEANFELIEIPHVRQSGKNSADIRMVVDALDLCYTKEHVDTFVIISGDSDFSPLVSKLRENAKTVIGVGVKNSTSDLLIANCDEFIYYDDLVRDQRKGRRTATVKDAGKTATKAASKVVAAEVPAEVPEVAAKSRGRRSTKAAASPAAEAPRATSRRRGRTGTAPVEAPTPDAVDEAHVDALADADRGPSSGAEAHGDPDGRHQAGIAIVVDTLEALSSERGSDRIFGSMIKQAIKRVRPQFSEGFHGFRSFNAMLEAAQSAGALDLERDEKSGGYVVRLRGALA